MKDLLLDLSLRADEIGAEVAQQMIADGLVAGDDAAIVRPLLQIAARMGVTSVVAVLRDRLDGEEPIPDDG